MDPKYQVEEPTFATTLSGIGDLRKQYGAQDDDWARYKISVVNAIRSGARLEQEMADVRAALEQCARRTAVSTLSNKVADLELHDKMRSSLTAKWAQRVWQVVLLLLAVKFGQWLK